MRSVRIRLIRVWLLPRLSVQSVEIRVVRVGVQPNGVGAVRAVRANPCDGKRVSEGRWTSAFLPLARVKGGGDVLQPAA